MFALPEHEREAFFALLDEYFTQRPHLAPPNFQASAAGAPAGRKQPPPPPRRGNSTSSSVLPPSAAAAAAHAPPPATPGPREALTQSIGFMNTNSAGAALGSIVNKSAASANQALHKQWEKHTGATTSTTSTPPTQDYYSGGGGTASPPPAQYPGAAAAPPAPARAAAVSADPPGEEAVALYKFSGTEPGDLQVEQGEHVYLLEAISDDWWRAQSLDGARTGIVPTTYVQQL